MAESPELPDGFRWFKIELRRSVMVVIVVFCTASRGVRNSPWLRLVMDEMKSWIWGCRGSAWQRWLLTVLEGYPDFVGIQSRDENRMSG